MRTLLCRKISKATRTRLFVALLLASMTAASVWPATAAELVLVESASCAWCRKWNVEIAPIYPVSAEAACAPLRRVDIAEISHAGVEAMAPVIYTPTFVIVEGGKEVGRIVGYAGEDFFWPMLQEQLAKLSGGCPQS